MIAESICRGILGAGDVCEMKRRTAFQTVMEIIDRITGNLKRS